MDVQRVERIAYLVGDRGREELDRVQALAFQDARLLLAVARDVTDDRDKPARHVLPFRQRNGVEVEYAVFRAGDLDFAPQDVGPLVVRAHFEQAVPLEAGEQRIGWAGCRAVGVEAEKRGGGAVRVCQAHVGIDDKHAFLDRLEDRFEEAALARQAREVRLEAFGVDLVELCDKPVEKSGGHGGSGNR